MNRSHKSLKSTYPPMERMWNMSAAIKWNPPMPRSGDVMDSCLPITSDKYQTKAREVANG